MTPIRLHAAPHKEAAAAAFLAASAGFTGAALWTHLSLASLGPICGLSRPGAFFLHCPACPAALVSALLGLSLAFSALLGRRQAYAREIAPAQ